MSIKRYVAAIGVAVVSAACGMPAAAQVNTEMELQQLSLVFGNLCQMGNPQGCQASQYVQQGANYLQQAGMACQQGNPQACQAYQQGAAEVHANYMQVAQQLQAAGYGGGGDGGNGGYVDPLGQTHEQRMQAIQNFGAQNTQNFNNRMAAMDRNMAQWSAANQ